MTDLTQAEVLVLGIIAERERQEAASLEAARRLQALRDMCPHPDAHVTKKHGANTGNYDPSADCSWTDNTCHACGKKWTMFRD